MNQEPPTSIPVNLYVGEGSAQNVEAVVSDSQHFSVRSELRNTSDGRPDLESVALGFNANSKLVVLKYNEGQATYANFLNQCRTPSAAQARLIKEIADRKAADIATRAAAEAVRAEQMRIAQAHAAEQARIVAEQAMLAELRARELHAAAIAANTKRRNELIASTFGASDSAADNIKLSNTLVGKTTIPSIDLGYSGTLGNQYLVNGRPKVFLINTLVFNDGSEVFRVEDGIARGNAVQYKTFKRDLEFRIDKVEFRSDNLEVKLSIANTGEKADVKIMLPKDWQKTMSNESVLASAEKFLSISW